MALPEPLGNPGTAIALLAFLVQLANQVGKLLIFQRAPGRFTF
jgi:hypothetical protein